MQVVVLSGGKGSRLWPISNTESPKPFIKMEDGLTLVRKTLIRASSIKQVKNIIIVTEHSHTLGIKSEYLKIANSKLPPKLHLILEPFGKDTAAAIASATLYVNNMCGLDEMILVFPVDHLIADQNAFARALKKAKSLAINGKIVTFGIKPQYPESAYGYIEVSGENAKSFTEKLSKALAQEYIKRGNFLWNSGIFFFKARTILQEMYKYCPEILHSVRSSMNEAQYLNSNKYFPEYELDSRRFSLVPAKSIDYAVMEKSDKIAVVRCDSGWTDVGTWGSLSKAFFSDANGNNIKGDTKSLLHNISNCYIDSNAQPVAVVGVKDLIIISTKNAILITDKQNSCGVKNVYTQLKNSDFANRGHFSYIKQENFPWGQIIALEESSFYKIKKIKIDPYKKLNIASYFQCHINLVVITGTAKFFQSKKITYLKSNESQYITPQDNACLANDTHSYLILIAISTKCF